MQEASPRSLRCHAGVQARELYRVMRAAVQLGVFRVARRRDAQGQPRFQNNRLSAVLRKDHPNCLKHVVGCCNGKRPS